MTDADAELAAWLRNGEMAQYNTDNPDLTQHSRITKPRAVLVEQADARPKRRAKWHGSEYTLQDALFQWAHDEVENVPELTMMFAIPNGQYRKGQRPEPGLMPGVPDTFLAVPRGGHSGLFIELKVGYNKPSDVQRIWLDKLELAGYKTAVCYDLPEAQQLIIDYINGHNNGKGQ